jgi:dephospho-CoA kinase
MLLVGLTGSIATGKSTVAGILKEMGCTLIDADQIAREVVTPSSPGLEALCRQFGRGILDKSGALNRSCLGKIVFHDPAARARLNGILHPLIIRRMQEEIEKYRHDPEKVVFVDVPLLFETGLDAMMDYIVVVYADEATQLCRLMERDQMAEEEAGQRIATQMPVAEKVAKADFVIDNTGLPQGTIQQVKNLLTVLQNRVKDGGDAG